MTHKRDTIIHHLATCVSPGRLADRFRGAGLINDETREKAFISATTEADKIRPMIDVIIVKTKLNAAKCYKKFIDVLKEIGDLEDLIEFIESPVEQ